MDNKAEAILDQALGEFNDGLGGAKAKSSGKKKKGSKKKKPAKKARKAKKLMKRFLYQN